VLVFSGPRGAMNTTKECKECGESDISKLVPIKRKGKIYYRNWCFTCQKRHREEWFKAHPERVKKSREKTAQRIREERETGVNTAYYIWRDSRKSDRKHGRQNDLTRDFTKEQIAKGCSYCGETELRMTLDRIDNDLGHLQSNVIPSCVRCNHVRGDMPYDAWVVVGRSMKQVRKQGLFGDWTGRARPWSKTKQKTP